MLELLGSGGSTLVSHRFDVTFQDIEGGSLTTVFFQVVLADPGGVTGIRLSHSGQLLASISKSAAAPSEAFTYPVGGESFTGDQTVTWTVSDADTPLANLRQTLEYSADNGSTWTPVAANLPGTITSYLLDTNLLAKSTQGKLRLWVTDGLNNSQADSNGVFNVPNHPPLANILAPASDGFIPGSSPTLLQGQATDVEDASLPGDNFLWMLDGTQTLGIGASVQVVLPNGEHTLTLTVLDKDGASGNMSIKVFVDVHRLFFSAIQR
jgi:hypothetical protein